MLSSPWIFQQPSAYARPLGLTEQIFHWDGEFEGTADSVQSAEIEIQHGTRESILSPTNVENAWASLKLQFPLLGSQIVQRPDESLWFVVNESRLRSCGPDEIHYHDVASAEEAQAVSSNIPNSPRLLSVNLLACLLLLRRTDNERRFHVLIHAAHTIADGNANATLLRTFLDKLASALSEVEVWDVKGRLPLSSSCEDLSPVHRLNAIRRRWRQVVGAVISANRMSKLHGGQTLPCKVTNMTSYQPANSSNISTMFAREETQGILQSCRQLGQTFGVVYPVIGQVALARILCRKYVRGEISQAEWEFRKREPMITGGPLNLRPFLDQEWYEKGGATNASLAIGFYFYILPYMPLGIASNISPGAPVPSYSDLLSNKRFAYRCTLIKKQAELALRHPLQYEVGIPRLIARLRFLSGTTKTWRQHRLFGSIVDHELLSVQEQATAGVVYGHGGSSFGNTDGLFPEFYPISGEPVLRLVASGVILHCRPKELYLGAATGRGQLRLYIYFDANVYDANLVREWLDEVQGAIKHYLLPKKLALGRL